MGALHNTRSRESSHVHAASSSTTSIGVSGKSYCSLVQAGIAGVDEAGRGPLAGPVVAAAVILEGTDALIGLDDSKRLSPSRRARLAQLIEEHALSYCLGWASVQEIDALNILRASLLAMQRAISGLRQLPLVALVDGNQAPVAACPVCTVIGGDRRVAAISAASVLAKVARDRYMEALDQQYPGYGFARHKGYPTREHLQSLARIGVSDCHRRSFRPVMIAATNSAMGHER